MHNPDLLLGLPVPIMVKIECAKSMFVSLGAKGMGFQRSWLGLVSKYFSFSNSLFKCGNSELGHGVKGVWVTDGLILNR